VLPQLGAAVIVSE